MHRLESSVAGIGGLRIVIWLEPETPEANIAGGPVFAAPDVWLTNQSPVMTRRPCAANLG